MVIAIISWVLNLINPWAWTMVQPRTCTLWYAFSGDLYSAFPIVCILDQDNIDTLKKKIWEVIENGINNTVPHYSKLDLYCPAVQLNYTEKFKVEDGERLHPHCVITSNPLFPDSKDSYMDAVIVVNGDVASQGNKKHPKPQSLRHENDISLIPLFFDT